AMRKVIYHALAKLPEDRYQSAGEMMQDLRGLVGTDATHDKEVITSRDIARYTRLAADPSIVLSRRRHLRWLLALPACALVAVLWLWLAPSGPKPAAYQSYQQALELIGRYEKPGNLDRAIALLQTAVKTDPAFALAFAALGQAYALKARLSKDPRLLT